MRILPPLSKFISRQPFAPPVVRTAQQRRREDDAIDAHLPILIIGNHRELTLYRKAYLDHHGLRTLTPENKADALEAIVRAGFRAVVLSYTLSHEDVLEYSELIRQICPRCPIVVINRSGVDDPRVRPEATVRAEDGPEGLLAALRRVLNHHSQ